VNLEQYIKSRKNQNLFRELPQNNIGVLDFSSNDYLALSRDKYSIQAGIYAAQKYGTGSTGSRLLSGNKSIFEEFEDQIANDKNTESALIFNSGYVANLSVISAFSSLGYSVIFDKLNHASMYDGANPQKLKRFNHLNYDALQKILESTPGKKLIASETVFGMDGDVADLKQLQRLADQYETLLYLDEAHATGLYGSKGYGLSTDSSLTPNRTIIMGTFSKALASSGAYVACSNEVKNFLIQVCRGFVYSTALSPFCIGVAQYNWQLIPSLSDTRNQLLLNAEKLREMLRADGHLCGSSNTNIIPILFSSTDSMLQKHNELKNAGIITSAVRRPTSPTPRLRIALNIQHSESDLEKLRSALSK